ncbi:hypothetical protein D3C81_1634680 [compost metagenome]
MDNLHIKPLHLLPVNHGKNLRRPFLHFTAHRDRNRLLVKAMLGVPGHFAKNSEIRIALHIPKHLAFLEKNCPLLSRITILALGDRGYSGLHDMPAANHNRSTGVHVRNDMAQSAINSLLRSIKG